MDLSYYNTRKSCNN